MCFERCPDLRRLPIERADFLATDLMPEVSGRWLRSRMPNSALNGGLHAGIVSVILFVRRRLGRRRRRVCYESPMFFVEQ